MVGWSEVSELIEKIKETQSVLLTQRGCADLDDSDSGSHYGERTNYDNITRLVTELPLIFSPRLTWRRVTGSYSGKHVVERWRRDLWCYKNGLWDSYCANGDFIVAMLLQDNADFRVVRFYKESDGSVNINCGFRVVAHELR